MKNLKSFIKKEHYGLFSILICICILVSFTSCVEDTTIETDSFENLLVINASISNEMKQHEVLLTRSYRFQDSPEMETGADVKIIGNGVEYNFNEVEDGRYISQEQFSAGLNVEYQLKITTKNGNKYSSTSQKLAAVTEIDKLYVERVMNDDGVDGLNFLVDSFDPSNASKFYRYEYEETFKIIAPMWVSDEAFVVSDHCPGCEVGLMPRDEDTRVCYRTEISNQQNLLENESLDTDKVEGHIVRFLPRTDYEISHRYSLLVKQFVISESAYTYYKTLGDFSAEGSVFSQIQTGFVEGNMSSESDPNEKVIGFFDVNSVAEKRVFINYSDFYEGAGLPDFPILCNLQAPALEPEECGRNCGPLTRLISNKAASFFEEYAGEPAFENPGPYIMVPRACGDCTVLGTNEVPEFWIE